jgi:hypothetical protein
MELEFWTLVPTEGSPKQNSGYGGLAFSKNYKVIM